MINWIVCSGPDWYRPSITSAKQIISQFHKNNYKILYVNPISFKSPSVNSISKKSVFLKIKDKFFTHLTLFKKVKKGFYVYVPFYLPVFKPWAESLNEKLIILQLTILKFFLRIKPENSILWSAGNFTILSEYKNNYFKKITQAGDFVSDFRASDDVLKRKLLLKESELCNKSDVIFASSKRVKEKLSQITIKPVDLLLHGVNFNHFNNYHTPSEEIIKIKKKGLPIAGYFGSLSDTANDLRVFEILAKNHFSVVIIGKVLGDYSSLKKLENIHLLGPVDYNILPAYGQSFDLCFMSWHMAEWIRNSYPIKTLEYLAMGKPVVSVSIPILKDIFPDLIYFADSPNEFLLKAQLAINEDNDERRNKRTNAVLEYDWSNRFEVIKSRIGINGIHKKSKSSTYFVRNTA